MKIGAGLLLASRSCLRGARDSGLFPRAAVGSGGTTPTTLSSGVFYVLNQTTKQIVGYSINTGTLGAISGAPQTFLAGAYLHRHRAERRVSLRGHHQRHLPVHDWFDRRL